MEREYLFETFKSESQSFDRDFTGFLNGKSSEHWKVEHCSFCHDNDGSRLWASCLFKSTK